MLCRITAEISMEFIRFHAYTEVLKMLAMFINNMHMPLTRDVTQTHFDL